MGFCAEKGLCVGNTYYKHRSLDKYTKVAKDQEGGEVKSMIDPVLVKRAMVESAREVCGSVRMGGNNPKSMRCNDKVKAATRRKEVLAASDESKERCMEAYREKKKG